MARRTDSPDLLVWIWKEGAMAPRRRFRQLSGQLLGLSRRTSPLRLGRRDDIPAAHLLVWGALHRDQGRPFRVLGDGPQSGRGARRRMASPGFLDDKAPLRHVELRP